jgi:hypothetical protein
MSPTVNGRGDSHCGITPAFPLAPQANYPGDSLETVIPADVRSAASAVLAFAVGQAPGDTSGLFSVPAQPTNRISPESTVGILKV